MPSDLEASFKVLKQKVLEKKPVLAEILRKRGTKTLFEYAKLYIDVNLNPPIKRRQGEFIGTFKKQVARRLGPEIAESAATQLYNYYFVSTVDHHSPLFHPFFINGNLLTAGPHFENTDPNLKNVIVLSFGNISMNNSSFPRGLIFNSFNRGKIEMQRLSFFPAKDRLCPVYNFRSYTREDVEKVRSTLNDLVKVGSVHVREQEKINGILDQIYLKPEMLEAENYSEQITKSNFLLWQRFFDNSNLQPPNIVYLEIESLVNEVLLQHHIFEHTIITHFLLDQKYDLLIFKYFEGIQGAFSRQDKVGSYLFWGLPKGAKYRIQLWKEGNYLVSEDGTYKLELTAESLARAIRDKELIPSMMLCFIVLSFYYGLKCLGGFSQVNYLTYMKNSYIKMQVDLGNYRSIEVCARAQTKEMGADFTIAFLGGPNGELVPATGLDLILYGDENTWPTIVAGSKQITLDEAVTSLMHEFYPIVYPETERDPELLKITPRDVARLTKLDQKIKPCCKINGEC